MRAAIARSIALCFALTAMPAAAEAQGPPAGSAGTVTLPLADYDRLVDRAARPPAPADLPPVPAVVVRADVSLRVSATDLRGTVTLHGDVLRAGRAKVPLLVGAIILDAQLAGTPVSLVHEDGTTSAILSGPAPFTITLAFGSEVTTEPGRAMATIPAIRAGTVRATVEAPGENVEVRVDRGLVGSRTSAAGKTTTDVTLEAGVPARLSWSSREQASRAPRDVRLVTDVKSLITVAEGELRMASLFDVSVVQGQAESIDLQIPDGFDVVAVSGGSVEAGVRQGGRVTVSVREPARRRHQFLLSLEHTGSAGAGKTELALPGVQGAQRETGEVSWEGVGTIELTAAEAGALRRLDVSEVHSALAALARSPLLAAFRYQRRGQERVTAAFDVRRFGDAPVLGAVAESATVTTLVSSEGRALSEFGLLVRNRGQLFLKLALPKGATLLSAEVAGEPVKPVEAADGARVPLLRPGFRPSGAYPVSFVYVEGGTAFDKKGEAEMRLPRLDLPIGVMTWEVFLPDRYRVRHFEGDVIAGELLPVVLRTAAAATPSAGPVPTFRTAVSADQVRGLVVDTTGAVMPGATVTVVSGGFSRAVVSDASGQFLVSGVPAGPVSVTASLAGFKNATVMQPSPGGPPTRLVLEVSGVQETVVVSGAAPTVAAKGAAGPPPTQVAQAPSQNVLNLQQRVSGVLPVRIDIPRAGQSFRFVRPLVIDEETTLRFEYKLQ